MLEALKKRVLRANLELVERGLVLYTWGNASALDPKSQRVVIKPSGVDYDNMKAADMVVVDLADGAVVEGRLRPSSDTPTHLELYRRFEGLGGVVHTHSICATIWAQAGRDVPCLGTTHADYFYGAVPCTRPMTARAIAGDYEQNTGVALARRFKGIDPLAVPAGLVAGHGPFTWGRSVEDAVYHSVVLEQCARMALETTCLNPQVRPISRALLDKHYLRKHGAEAYYGQK